MRLWQCFLVLALLAIAVKTVDIDDDFEWADELDDLEELDLPDVPEGLDPMMDIERPPEIPPIPYERIVAADDSFLETFDDEKAKSTWVLSGKEKFTGRWDVGSPRKREAVIGDLGLRLKDEARHHAISVRFPTRSFIESLGKDLSVSYEVIHEDDHTCGGGYIKLFDSRLFSGPDEFDNDTPYSVMFGPDKCGATDKVHLIIRHINPITGVAEEKHLRNPPRQGVGKGSHLYTLILKSDNTYEIHVDGKLATSGSMHEDFEPAFTPPKEVADVNDVKPDDWTDEQKIQDPDAVKPDDWDEEAPRFVSDPEAQMPEGWLEDEGPTIPDPDAQKPEDWDDEEDGMWSVPSVTNPKCVDASGCGKWKAPQIPNPNYKGPWKAPMIDNPMYTGAWEPRQIANPDYYEEKNPHAVMPFDALGIELWTMNGNIVFDNFYVKRSRVLEPQLLKIWTDRVQVEKSHRHSLDGDRRLAMNNRDDLPFLQRILMASRMMLRESSWTTGALLALVPIVAILLVKFCRKPARAATGGPAAEEEKEEVKKSEKSEKSGEDSVASEGREEKRRRKPRPTNID